VAPDLLLLRVPDDRLVKNRLHLDLRPDDRAAEVARLPGPSATHADLRRGDVSRLVLADPEGSGFCVLRALPPQ